ncbi:hypothetical protein QJQ45_015236, partial [Haematococcus lacustris]
MNSLPVEETQVLIHKGETRSPSFRAKNPFGKVPCLLDSGFCFHSFLTLTTTGCMHTAHFCPLFNVHCTQLFTLQVPDHWYPRSCLQRRATLESALHWYHSNIRAGCARLVFHKVRSQGAGLSCPKAPHLHLIETLRPHSDQTDRRLLLVPAKVLAAKLGAEPREHIAQEGLELLRPALQQLEGVWLRNSAFVAGDQVSVADLLMCCELEQLTMLNK